MTFSGEGYLVLDWTMLIATYSATAINSYLAIIPGYVRRGTDLLFRRMVAVYFIGTSVNLSAFLVKFEFDLPTTPQYAVLQILLCVATAGIGISRVRRKHAGDAPSTYFDREH